MALIDTLLSKLGVTSVDQLTPEERETYRTWSDALRGRKLTDDDVSRFLETQIEDCMVKLTTVKLNDREVVIKLSILRTGANVLETTFQERICEQKYKMPYLLEQFCIPIDASNMDHHG